ncbi:hypothetical protein BG015_003031, partial [Linnemannia schmuckeri]
MVLTDYTEHDLLPFQDAPGRPKGQACIITTLWDEHCTTAQNKDIRAGDLVYLRNLLPKVGPNGTIELNMNGYRDRGYREMHPIQKLELNDSAVKELQMRKAKYEQHLNVQEEEEEGQIRQNIIQRNQDLEGASSEPLPESQPTGTLRPIELGPRDVPNQPLPLPQPTPPFRLIKLEHRSVSAQSSPPPHSSPTLTTIKLEPGSVPTQPQLQPQPTHILSSANLGLGSVSEQPPPQPQPTPIYETKLTGLPESASSLLNKVPTTPTLILSIEASSSPASPYIITTSTTRSLSQDIQPDVNTPNKREPTPLVAVKLEASSQAIQSVVDTFIECESNPVTKREFSPSIKRESSSLVAVKLEPNCQDSQSTASSTSAQPR